MALEGHSFTVIDMSIMHKLVHFDVMPSKRKLCLFPGKDVLRIFIEIERTYLQVFLEKRYMMRKSTNNIQ